MESALPVSDAASRLDSTERVYVLVLGYDRLTESLIQNNPACARLHSANPSLSSSTISLVIPVCEREDKWRFNSIKMSLNVICATWGYTLYYSRSHRRLLVIIVLLHFFSLQHLQPRNPSTWVLSLLVTAWPSAPVRLLSTLFPAQSLLLILNPALKLLTATAGTTVQFGLVYIVWLV